MFYYTVLNGLRRAPAAGLPGRCAVYGTGHCVHAILRSPIAQALFPVSASQRTLGLRQAKWLMQIYPASQGRIYIIFIWRLPGSRHSIEGTMGAREEEERLSLCPMSCTLTFPSPPYFPDGPHLWLMFFCLCWEYLSPSLLLASSHSSFKTKLK